MYLVLVHLNRKDPSVPYCTWNLYQDPFWNSVRSKHSIYWLYHVDTGAKVLVALGLESFPTGDFAWLIICSFFFCVSPVSPAPDDDYGDVSIAFWCRIERNSVGIIR